MERSDLALSFLGAADCFGGLERIESLRITAEALHIQSTSTTNDAPKWSSMDTPLPAHAHLAARRGTGALYAALLGLRAARLGFALRRWAIAMAWLEAEELLRNEDELRIMERHESLPSEEDLSCLLEERQVKHTLQHRGRRPDHAVPSPSLAPQPVTSTPGTTRSPSVNL
jgi:C4-dicarboxylate-specific signal transduction histidine kinase